MSSLALKLEQELWFMSLFANINVSTIKLPSKFTVVMFLLRFLAFPVRFLLRFEIFNTWFDLQYYAILHKHVEKFKDFYYAIPTRSVEACLNDLKIVESWIPTYTQMENEVKDLEFKTETELLIYREMIKLFEVFKQVSKRLEIYSNSEYRDEVEFFKNAIPTRIILSREDYLFILKDLETLPEPNPVLEKYLNL